MIFLEMLFFVCNVLLISLTSNIKCELLEHPGWKFFDYNNCGDVRAQTRITKGKISALGQYPWMARLGYEQSNKQLRFQCGGSLISPVYILTAGHCIHGWTKELKIVRLGENFLNGTEDCDPEVCAPPVQDICISKMHLHENYNRSIAKNDIGLLKLEKEAVYNDFVKPICLPRGDILRKDFIGQYVDVAGWGVTDPESLKEADTLLYVNLPVRDSCACSRIVPGGEVYDTQFCAGFNSGEDSCQGDSGGPMMKMEDLSEGRKYVVLGVVSIGKNYCGESPAIYTNVMKYIDWILEIVCKAE